MPPLSPTVQKLSQHNLTESSRYFSISCHLEKPGSVARNMTGKSTKTATNAQWLLKSPVRPERGHQVHAGNRTENEWRFYVVMAH